ncbi:RNase A-like domain-containing protein [Streptomyces sp. ODS28]|uniref:RNase A-like domain-containing protein n=1 Tax=Streptomyces sp. ODS28 TaxID=3136688 RepID=UPI0031EC2C1C
MGAFEEAKEWLVETMGMWWPDADEDKLREAATAWRTFADAVGDVTQAANPKAREVIHHNTGQAIDAFEIFWNRYYGEGGGKGWLHDLEKAARDMAHGLDEFANKIEEVKDDIDTQLAIDAAVIAAGIGLSVVTFGAGAAASASATTAMVEMASSLGVSVSTTVARIAATTLTGIAFGGIESVTVDLAVAQPLQIAAGKQDGLSLAHAQEAGKYGAITGGVFGAGGGAYKSVKDAGGIRTVLNDVRMPQFTGPRLALPGGPRLATPGGEPPGWLLKVNKANSDHPLKHSPRAWPKDKRRGPLPQHRPDLRGDEGKPINGNPKSAGHTLEKHVEVTSRELRDRLRADSDIPSSSRYLDEASANRYISETMAENNQEITQWLKGSKSKLELYKTFDEHTGLSISREAYMRGHPPEWVKSSLVILKRDPTADAGYRILTSYPTP